MSPEVKGSLPEIVKNEHGLYEGNLIYYFRVVFNHAQNLRNPYHNFRHMCHVLYLCYKACVFYSGFEPKKMNPREMRNLLISALFHDFDHTGKGGSKEYPDSINISRAIAGIAIHILPEDNDYLVDIINLIKTTEFPYTVPAEKVNLLGQVLREADLSQALSVAWMQQVVFGLSEEWGNRPWRF